MKIFILLLTASILAQAKSLVPRRVVTPNLEIFSDRNVVLPNGDVEVRVSTFDRDGSFHLNSKRLILPKDTFERYKLQSQAVLEALPRRIDGEMTLNGTAFNIGNNLVLTNNHVLDANFLNTRHCDGFKLRNFDGDTYRCQKVHFCSPKHDVCLIEMSPNSKRDCFRCRPRDISLAVMPALKLKSNYKPKYHEALEETFTAIGNTDGKGIHFSQGQGAIFQSEYVKFWAPMTGGNSGGPLLNSEGLVVGIVKHQTILFQDEDLNMAYNGAAPAELTINLIREALKNQPELLLKFNQSVIE